MATLHWTEVLTFPVEDIQLYITGCFHPAAGPKAGPRWAAQSGHTSCQPALSPVPSQSIAQFWGKTSLLLSGPGCCCHACRWRGQKEPSPRTLPARPLSALRGAPGDGAMGQPPAPCLWNQAPPPWQGCLRPPEVPRDPLQRQRWPWRHRQGRGRAMVVMGRGLGSVQLPPIPWTSLLLWYWWGWTHRQCCCLLTTPACPVPFWQLPAVCPDRPRRWGCWSCWATPQGSQPPPSPRFALASLAVFRQCLWAGTLRLCRGEGQAPAWPPPASSTAGVPRASLPHPVPRSAGSPQAPQSRCPLPLATTFSSSKEAPALEPAVYWAPVGTHLPFPSPFPPPEPWREESWATNFCGNLSPSPCPQARSGVLYQPRSEGAACIPPAPRQCPTVTLFCTATFRRAVKHLDELNNTRQCMV